MIPCPLYTFTHWQCPFCGAQRGVIALLHGDLATWWNYNPVLWVLLPYFAILIAGEIHRPWQKKKWVQRCYSNQAVFCVVAILFIWAIVRNIFFND